MHLNADFFISSFGPVKRQNSSHVPEYFKALSVPLKLTPTSLYLNSGTNFVLISWHKLGVTELENRPRHQLGSEVVDEKRKGIRCNKCP